MVETRPSRNPYIIGSPIDKKEEFFGRESLFRFIEDNLYQGVKVILLHGQRRVGKSSVLRQIPNFVGNNEFIFIHFDLEHRSQSKLSDILHEFAKEIAQEIAEYLPIEQNTIKLPTVEEINNDTRIFTQRFFSKIFNLINGKKIVFLLDEFDVINNQIENPILTQQGLNFFQYLGRLIRQQENLFIIPVLGRFLDDMPNLQKFFKEAPYQEIGLLDDVSTKKLITKPSQGTLTYDQKAIQEIFKLSAGHPYFTQVICFTLFSQARETGNWNITHADVENVVERIFDDDKAQAGLAWFRDGLPIHEKVVFSAVAEAQKRANTQANNLPEEPLTLLMEYGVIPTDNLIKAAKKLFEQGFLDNTERRIKVELVGLWLVRNHQIHREIWELEKLEIENVNQLFSVATNLYSQGNKQNSVQLYNQILDINPNHFQTILFLAKGHLEIGNFDQAIELYQRAYKFAPILNKDRLLYALEDYGHSLLIQKEFAKARQQYERVLEIEPHRLSAQQRLAEIRIHEEKSSTINPVRWAIQKQNIKVLLATVIVVIATSVVSGVYRTFKPCPIGQQEQFGVFCVADENRISSGSRTFFPDIINSNRDRGIQAFKKGRYKDAAEFFAKAVANNRNDPEVLIYYNNALARQNPSRFILAAVVPAEKHNTEDAQEMLRGIAQAQNQFNEKGGLGGRLLEIVIANDGNYPDKAQQVAAELVQDKSILGIIGHNSSGATKAALGEYQTARLPIISPTSTSILLDSDVFFRTTPSDAAAGKKLAEYAFKKLNLQKVVIFANSNSPYSNSMREVFTKEFEKLGGNLVYKPLINITSPTLNIDRELESSLFRFQAQAAVLFPDMLHTDIAVKIAKANHRLLREEANQGKKGLHLLGGDTLYSNSTLQQDADGLEGLIIAVPWFRQTAQAQNFSRKAIEQWKRDVSWRTATSFDATQAFIKSFSGNPSRAKILENLKNVNLTASETSGYPLWFNRGERQSEVVLVQVQGRKFVVVPEQ